VGVDPDRDRPIVHQFHFHVGAERAGLYFLSDLQAHLGAKSFVHRNGYVRFGGMDIGRAVSLLCGGVQGKLADHHHFAFRFDDRTVHNAVFIVKDAQVGNLLAQP